MNKKYELIAEKSIDYFGVKLFKIRALISFGLVKAGDEGGYIESEKNLNQEGDAWIFEKGKALGKGTIEGGTIEGGTIWGGTIEGGTIKGGTILGGTIWGGTIWGGTILGGTIWGGTILGGTIKGGTIEGGTIKGGTIEGGTIKNSSDIIVFQNVGSEFGVLTAIREKKEIRIHRGSFNGTLKEFKNAVSNKHSGTLHEKAYLRLADYIEFHFTELHPMEK